MTHFVTHYRPHGPKAGVGNFPHRRTRRKMNRKDLPIKDLGWRPHEDSNLKPLAPEANALSN